MQKPLIAVITGTVNGFAEKELLRGIIAENQKNGYSTVVFSNIYNIVQEDAYLECERRIYELVCSQDICGVILFCESFVEERARLAIASVLQGLTVPVIGIGSRLKEFTALSVPCFDTDDVQELGDLTGHLIDVHGFTDIVLLTGMQEVEVSRRRVEGYMQSLRKHGIAFEPDHVVYGDFWMTSGEALADSMLRGERPFPQAILCANDRMAYGLLRRFSEAGIPVPEQITVVAYEYSGHRMYYDPPLTCYRRNREKIGTAAANRMHCLLSGKPAPAFESPRGCMVFGASCSCPMNKAYSLAEQRNAADRQNDYDLNLFCTMDHRMTLCRDMKQLIQTIGEYHWLIRNKRSLYLRLYADWYDPDAVSGDLMQSRCVLPWQNTSVFEHHRYDLQCLFEREPGAVVCYYAPVFSGNRLYGDMAVLYDTPDGYDEVFRYWMKSISIGLEYMRLKNDIHYLLSCQSISEYRDSLTGLYNAKGLKRAFSAQTAQEGQTLYCVMLKLSLNHAPVNEADISRKTEMCLCAAGAVRRFSKDAALAGHISDDTFVCFVQSRADAEQLSDLMSAMLLSEEHFWEYAGTDAFACAAAVYEAQSYEELLEQCEKQIGSVFRKWETSREFPGFPELLELRDQIYASPEITFSQDNELLPDIGLERCRARYKKCFGITFHQDCITARITKARYYLAVTQLDLAEISEKCGYFDHKYFQRQFSAVTGMPALQYRSLLGR